MRVDAWLPRAARLHPERLAVNELTYAELLTAAREGAWALAARGVRAGDRVAVAMPGGVHFAVALHATWLLGAVVVPHDLRLPAEERPPADHVVDWLERTVAEGAPLPERHDLGAPALGLQTSGTACRSSCARPSAPRTPSSTGAGTRPARSGS
jgi:non-ribosomal peptide synthetase component F